VSALPNALKSEAVTGRGGLARWVDILKRKLFFSLLFIYKSQSIFQFSPPYIGVKNSINFITFVLLF